MSASGVRQASCAASCAMSSSSFQIGIVNLIMDNEVPFLPIFNCYF